MEHVLVAVGACSLGILLGALIGIFVAQSEKFDAKALNSAISVLGGSGVIAVFHLVGGKGVTLLDPWYWLYPVGLLVGFLFRMAIGYDDSE